MIRGIPVVNNQYAGDSFEWLRPLPIVCGIDLVLGYTLLGAGWLILRSEGALQAWAWKRIPWLAGAALAEVCAAFIIALGDRDRISGALHERTWGLVFPFIGLLAIYFIFLSLRLRPQALPFTMTLLVVRRAASPKTPGAARRRQTAHRRRTRLCAALADRRGASV
jgi:cytochrome bd ubiquinol oxidase subunit II